MGGWLVSSFNNHSLFLETRDWKSKKYRLGRISGTFSGPWEGHAHGELWIGSVGDSSIPPLAGNLALFAVVGRTLLLPGLGLFCLSRNRKTHDNVKKMGNVSSVRRTPPNPLLTEQRKCNLSLVARAICLTLLQWCNSKQTMVVYDQDEFEICLWLKEANNCHLTLTKILLRGLSESSTLFQIRESVLMLWKIPLALRSFLIDRTIRLSRRVLSASSRSDCASCQTGSVGLHSCLGAGGQAGWAPCFLLSRPAGFDLYVGA